MLVQSPKQRRQAGQSKRRRTLLLILGLPAILVATGLAFAAGFAFRDFIRPSLQALTGRTQLADALDSMRRAPGRWVRARLDPAPIETLNLDIKFRHLTRIHAKRQEALQRGLLITEDDDLVPAEIRHGERTVPVRVRLKGDLPDHLETDKWSFRIQTRRGEALFGMRRFSIQAPETRGFQAEPLFFSMLRDEGVLAPRYFFVGVTVNGKDIGLMALEEHFSKELLESQQRRESVILKFDESLFWENVLLNGDHGFFDNYQIAPIAAFQEGRVAKSATLSADLDAARALLGGFAAGTVSASEAFDEELLGRFLAVCELWGSLHAVRWHNLRFYFNPVDRELEPIGFDANLQVHHLGAGLLTMEEPISRRFLADPGVREPFVRTLRRLAASLVEGDLVAGLREREGELLRVLHQEFPLRAPIDFGPLAARASELRFASAENLESFAIPVVRPGRTYPAIVRAVFFPALSALEVRNLLPVPVVVESATMRTRGNGNGSAPAEAELAGLPVRLAATPRGGEPASVRLEVPRLGLAGGTPVVEGRAVIEGETRPYVFLASVQPPPARSGALPDPSLEELLRRPFLTREEGEGFLRVRPGTWSVSSSLVLPAGVGLRVAAGTVLRFGPDAVLVARGPLDFQGSAQAPVVLEPEPGAESWPGLVVLGAGDESRWSHVEVRSTSGFRHEGWSLTGGVTFHESDVLLEHCSFLGNRGEDALNVIRSRFRMVEPRFLDTASDAFDGDFTEGGIEGGRFERVGGDAVDVSGSRITLRGTAFVDVRDKAVSVGEGSRLEGEGLRVERAGTGVASKDRSETELRDVELRGIEHVALMSYTKKAEYGPASLSAREIRIEGAGERALAQLGSRLVLEGEEITPQDFDVDQLYREGYMRK